MTEPAIKEKEVELEVKLYPEGYIPNDEEEYMSKIMLAYFKDKLLDWKKQLEEESTATVKDLRENSSIESDLNDQASLEYGQTIELRTRDRERKLISKIDQTVTSLEEGEFGYCEETGDPIGVKRLLARPIATLCIEAKRRQEKQETGYAG